MTEYAPTMAARFEDLDRQRSSAGRADADSAPGSWRFEVARDWLASGGSVLVFGQKGTGKSTLLSGVVAAAGPPRILRCSPVEADAERPLSGLAELLSTVTATELALVPQPQQRLLKSVVLRGTDAAAEARPAVVRLAALELLRALARKGPVVLVIDDLHRLDHATTDLLRFVADRVDGLPIWVAAAEQVPYDCRPTGRPMCPAPLLMIGLEPNPQAGRHGR